MSQSVKVNKTSKFQVFDLKSVQQIDAGSAKREKTRANQEHGSKMATTGHIGGEFQITPHPAFIDQRVALFDQLWAEQEKKLAQSSQVEIEIVLPDGSVKQGVAFKTTPLDIALGISKGLADNIVVAKVAYTNRLEADAVVACDEDEEAEKEKAANNADSSSEGELWDISRPLVGSCRLRLLKYDDPEAKTVFSHSSAHILGAALEEVYGAYLTIGPPLQSGFYYDSYLGNKTITEEELKKLDEKANEICKKKYPFQRLVVSKQQALELFSTNPFKVSLITNKVPEGSLTTVYRCGSLIDLCMGPHVPNTGKIKAFSAHRTSSTNWLGDVNNDPLQRVYGIAFPEKDLLKQWQTFQAQAKARDHRVVGSKQELFFFHQLSPGSCFWLPHGARVYNRLISFIRTQYWARGYEEVVTPNIFNLHLWEISGHAQHYKQNMFVFDVEGQEWGMKPMNCPGHCLMFAHRIRSYRELPLRLADFGVLHRNENSGSLGGLTRVRRFQQDDAHIFCRPDQIKQEVLGALDFMKFVYDTFGMTYRLNLSTRPEKALGDIALWNAAEGQLAEALDVFAGPGNWKVNPGDGAFYGPKIDIQVFDAMERLHQCATVQLDFQLPIRFELQYKTAASGSEGEFERPVMIHRAMLGSLERMSAVLVEHWGGKWPFWLSPRQATVIPVDPKYNDYAAQVQQKIHDAGFFVEIDESTHTLNKKIREAQLDQFNYILVVGQQEQDKGTVNVRTRENEVKGELSVDDLIKLFSDLTATYK